MFLKLKNGATIKDIAKVANVSATAVSMALNNRPGVGHKTRQKILRIAKKLNIVGIAVSQLSRTHLAREIENKTTLT